MLKHLSIKNYAIIDELEVRFASGLHTITGETGAGKSILLGALSLVLGQRADTGVLRDAAKKSVIEAVFDISAYDMETFFTENDLDFENTSVFRREITPSGKSRAFINDTPVNLQILKDISSRLINVHAQHDTLELASPVFQLQMVDRLAQNEQLLSHYKTEYQKFTHTLNTLNSLKESLNKGLADKEYHSFLYNELEEADLDGCELEQLEEELNTGLHAEEIKQKLATAYHELEDSEQNLSKRINTVLSELQSVEDYMASIKEISARLGSAAIEIQDIASEVYALINQVEYDPESLEVTRGKVDNINRLLQKHHLQTVEELIALREDFKEKIQGIEHSDERIKELEIELNNLKNGLCKLADELHDKRQKSAENIAHQVNQLIIELGMPNAQFSIVVSKTGKDIPGKDGWDEIVFLFSANKGSGLKELKKVASGGELSRLMLSIKSLVAEKTALPTLIFDEIDTGISGEVAIKVGNLLRQTARGHQVISITHLPQIAARGDYHYFVYKETQNGNTYTKMRTLDKSERETELAKMLSGDAFSEAALENARQLLSR